MIFIDLSCVRYCAFTCEAQGSDLHIDNNGNFPGAFFVFAVGFKAYKISALLVLPVLFESTSNWWLASFGTLGIGADFYNL
jgi:uncharacterized protein (DUF983 family)